MPSGVPRGCVGTDKGREGRVTEVRAIGSRPGGRGEASQEIKPAQDSSLAI